MHAKAIAFVVGDEALDDADFFGEFGLSEAAFFANASEAFAERFVGGKFKRRKLESFLGHGAKEYTLVLKILKWVLDHKQ